MVMTRRGQRTFRVSTLLFEGRYISYESGGELGLRERPLSLLTVVVGHGDDGEDEVDEVEP